MPWIKVCILRSYQIATVLLLLCDLDRGFTKTLQMKEEINLRDESIQQDLESTAATPTVIECGRICYKSTNCMSMAYKGNTCRIYSRVNTTTDSITEPGWHYYSKDLKDYCTAFDGYHYVGNEQLCLKFYQTSVTYSQAFDACASDTSTLVKVDSKQKHEAIFQYLTDTQGFNGLTFIQGHRETTGSSNWVFDDGTELTYLPWSAGQPENNVGADYLLINTAEGGHWHDVNAVRIFFFLCEKTLL